MSILLAAVGGGPLIEAPTASDADAALDPTVVASLSWQNDGDIDALTSSDDQWMTPKISALAGQYEIKFEHSAGDSLDGGSAALSTWHVLSTSRTLAITTSGSTKSANGTYIIRYLSGTEIANGTWELTATVLA